MTFDFHHGQHTSPSVLDLVDVPNDVTSLAVGRFLPVSLQPLDDTFVVNAYLKHPNMAAA